MQANGVEAGPQQGAAAVERSWLDRMLRAEVREAAPRRVARRRAGQRRAVRAECRQWVEPAGQQRGARRETWQ